MGSRSRAYMGRSFAEATEFLDNDACRNIETGIVMIGDDQVIEIFCNREPIITYYVDGRIILKTTQFTEKMRNRFNSWAPVGIMGNPWRIVFYVQVGPGMFRKKLYVADSSIPEVLFYDGINVGQPAILPTGKVRDNEKL